LLKLNCFRTDSNDDLTPPVRPPTPVFRSRGAGVRFATLALAGLLAGTGTPAHADFVIKQGFAIGPSGIDGSPSFAAWAPNAVQGIMNGFKPVGNFATDPTAFQPITSFNIKDVIPTSDFNSWRGSASPTGAFANEYGNLLYNPVDIVDRTGQFSLSQVVFTGASSDNPTHPAASLLGSIVDLATLSYNAGRVGLIHNANGTITVINSGDANQLVDEIVYRGVGSYDTDLTVTGSGKTPQQLIDAELAVYNRALPLSFSANYTIYNDSVSRDAASIIGSSTATINAVPEPSSLAMASIGMIALVAASWRRGRRAS
jgi:hypothetical protein